MVYEAKLLEWKLLENSNTTSNCRNYGIIHALDDIYIYQEIKSEEDNVILHMDLDALVQGEQTQLVKFHPNNKYKYWIWS